MRGWSHKGKLEAATAAFLLVFVCGCTPLQTSAPVRQPSAAQVGEVQPGQALAPAGPLDVPYIPAPTTMTLCGEPVPLNREAVYERFDREFTITVYNHAQVYLWLKRMPRYFPVIEQRLRYYGLPDDLKYVAIAESDLLPNACSPAGAAGPWQFMPSTGAAYGLAQSRSVDNRFSLQHSTDSAFMLLKNLHDKYHSWALAFAAYNAGGRRVDDAMRNQGVHDYYSLCLPLETERYVFRILAIKAILTDPARYGYNLPPQYAYKPFRADQVTVSLPGPVSIRTIASAAGTTYSEIKRLNPVLRSDQIPAGTYQIKIPAGAREAFERNFKPEASVLLAQRPERPAVRPAPEKREVASAREKHEIRLAGVRRRIVARKGKAGRRVALKSRERLARTEAKRKAPKKLAKSSVHRAKGKARLKREVSRKAKGRAVHPKPKLHGAQRKGGRKLARR